MRGVLFFVLISALLLAGAASAQGRIKWRFRAESDYMLHRPAIGTDGTIFCNDVRGTLYALSPNGNLKWAFSTSGQGAQGPVTIAPDGTVCFCSDPGGPATHIYGVNPDGTQKWNFSTDTQGIIAGPNVGPDGNVYIFTDVDGLGLICLSPDDGHPLWANQGSPEMLEYGQIGSEIVFGPSQPGGQPNQIYASFDQYLEPDRLFGFDLSGNQKFAQEIPGQTDYFMQFQGQPSVGPDGTVYITGLDSRLGWMLQAHSPTDGHRLWYWTKDPANGMTPPDVAPDGTIYLVRSLDYLSAITPAGDEKWSYFDGTILDAPIVGPDGKLILLSGKSNFGQPGFLKAFSNSGHLLWTIDLPVENGGNVWGYTRARFAPDGRTAYLGTTVLGGSNTNYCYLYAIDTSTSETYFPTAATILKGAYNSGDLRSLGANDDNYWTQGAQYDPTDPLAVINSELQCDTNALSASYASGSITVVERSNTTQAKYRIRAVKPSGAPVVLLDNQQSGFSESIFTPSLPTPVSDFIDASNNNRLRLEIRCSSSNRLVGFFRHSIDLASWELTP